MPVNPDSDIVNSSKAFSNALTLDLTDEEIGNAYRLITQIKTKHSLRWQQKYPFDKYQEDQIHSMLAEFEDELKTTLAERCNILASVDTVPLLNGEPPVIEIIGKLPGDSIYTDGLDHEKKRWEVQRTRSDEAYRGEKS